MISAGTIVGQRYRLEEPIGQGGMATIWRAVHTTLDRPVAVKFLEAVGTGAEQLAARFLQEAKLAAGLRHRHVVDILDFGVMDDGTPFMVMELLEGQSLADRYNDGPPVTDWELLEIVAMTLSGLAAVHDAGILHRDVKPENIYLVRDADGVFPKLLDFGISRGFGSTGRVTRTGVVVGTPQYMSPEQARGKRDLDARSDLFSVGIVLYEGLAGEVPFDSENPGDILISVATEEPRGLHEHRPDLPPALLEIVHRALRKDPAERFQSAREMREAVLFLLREGEPMTGRPPSSVHRSSSPYVDTRGSGKLRVVSAPPTSGTGATKIPVLPRPAAEVSPIEPERLPPPRGASQKTRSGSGWLGALLIALALAVTGGGYAAYHYELVELPSAAALPGGAGEVRSGAEVAIAARTDGEVEAGPEVAPSPPTETVDVPSPPDPPLAAPLDEPDAASVPADGSTGDGSTGDGSLENAEATDAGVDASSAGTDEAAPTVEPSAPEAEPQRPTRRRRFVRRRRR